MKQKGSGCLEVLQVATLARRERTRMFPLIKMDSVHLQHLVVVSGCHCFWHRARIWKIESMCSSIVPAHCDTVT